MDRGPFPIQATPIKTEVTTLQILQRRDLRVKYLLRLTSTRHPAHRLRHPPAMTALFKSLMSQSPRSQQPTIRQPDLCEVSRSELEAPTVKSESNPSIDLRETSEIRRKGRDRPSVLWSNVRKSSAAHVQAAWLQGQREVGFQRVLFSSTRKVRRCLACVFFSWTSPSDMSGFIQERGPDRTINPVQ